MTTNNKAGKVKIRNLDPEVLDYFRKTSSKISWDSLDENIVTAIESDGVGIGYNDTELKNRVSALETEKVDADFVEEKVAAAAATASSDLEAAEEELNSRIDALDDRYILNEDNAISEHLLSEPLREKINARYESSAGTSSSEPSIDIDEFNTLKANVSQNTEDISEINDYLNSGQLVKTSDKITLDQLETGVANKISNARQNTDKITIDDVSADIRAKLEATASSGVTSADESLAALRVEMYGEKGQVLYTDLDANLEPAYIVDSETIIVENTSELSQAETYAAEAGIVNVINLATSTIYRNDESSGSWVVDNTATVAEKMAGKFISVYNSDDIYFGSSDLEYEKIIPLSDYVKTQTAESTYSKLGHAHAASDITSGTLAVARGGTGLTASPSMLTNLGSTTAANVLQASPRPGVTGTLPISSGGTGATTAEGARENLGITAETLGISAFHYVLASTPNYYKRAALPAADKTSVTIYANTQVNINNKGYISTADAVLSLDAAGDAATRKGKDVYIYACQPADENSAEPVFVLSLNSTVPDGYTAENSRKIGGFHCLCADAGTIDGHPASGYVAGDAIPKSCWDLLHRPCDEPEGKVWNGRVWGWIYLPSWQDGKMVSVYGGTVLDSETTPKMNGEKFAEQANGQGCRLMTRDEFIAFADGSNQRTNISGSADPVTTGGHVDTAGRRMISNFFLEDCCGAYWQFLQDTFEYYPGATWSSSNFYLSGYSWTTASVYNPSQDSAVKGSCHGLLRRVLAGGRWDYGSYCGSRCALCNYFSSSGWSNCSCRCASEPRAVNL